MKQLSFFIFSFVLISQMVFAEPVDDLFKAAMQCDAAGVQKALDAGVDVNAINPTTNQNVLAAAFFCPEVTK